MTKLIGTVNAGYTIQEMARNRNGKWYALARNLNEWVTWRVYGDANEPDYAHGHYFRNKACAEVDFWKRVKSY